MPWRPAACMWWTAPQQDTCDTLAPNGVDPHKMHQVPAGHKGLTDYEQCQVGHTWHTNFQQDKGNTTPSRAEPVHKALATSRIQVKHIESQQCRASVWHTDSHRSVCAAPAPIRTQVMYQLPAGQGLPVTHQLAAGRSWCANSQQQMCSAVTPSGTRMMHQLPVRWDVQCADSQQDTCEALTPTRTLSAPTPSETHAMQWLLVWPSQCVRHRLPA